jgi:hypothetical protein
MIVTVFRRRLREGKTFADFLEAWQAEKGFGVPTRVFNAQRLDDEREILTFGFVDTDGAALSDMASGFVRQEAVRHSRIDEVIESTELRAFYELRCEYDLSSTPRLITPGSAESLLGSFGDLPQPSVDPPSRP